jgi:hypothetical protein
MTYSQLTLNCAMMGWTGGAPGSSGWRKGAKMTAVGKSTTSAEALKSDRDYAAALALLAEGNDPIEVCRVTRIPLRVVLTLWDALDGEASGTMRRFGSVIDPRYRPRGNGFESEPSLTRAKVHWSTR